MSTTAEALEALAKQSPKFLKKVGLSVGLVVTDTARSTGLPISPESLRTVEGGQVAGLGIVAVQKILERHGITRVLSKEGGRTSRGSLGLMKQYVELLNELQRNGTADLAEAEAWWIAKVRLHFGSIGPTFHFDPAKSLRVNIEDLLCQAKDLQEHAGGTNYVGAMLQHLVGAKLDLVLGKNKIKHHGFTVADDATSRAGDYQVDAVCIHVTTSPSPALIDKCGQNLEAGLKPIIVTLGDGVAGAAFLLNRKQLADRVDVLDITQFLTANIYERSLFKASDCKMTLAGLLDRYNEIVAFAETDPVLRIRLLS